MVGLRYSPARRLIPMMSVHDSRTRAALEAADKTSLRSTRRGLYLRDSLVVLVLCLVTVTLFGITLFLFKSFEEHRADLARRWSARGRQALTQGRPDVAASDLRTALSYAPENSTDQLMLAQALAAAGHVEAANNYFLSLWDVHPGDGPINLQLARLARTRGNPGDAINYYRASIFGNWEQDGVERRREVRLELADYLLNQGQTAAAKAELLIAAGNAPEKDIALQLKIADQLQTLNDLPDALHYYRIASAQAPRNAEALASEGAVEYRMGDYATAARSLTGAAELLRKSRSKESGGKGAADRETEIENLTKQAAAARRLPELSLSLDLGAAERAEHLLVDAGIAQSRLRGCTAQVEPKPVPAAAVSSRSRGGTQTGTPTGTPHVGLSAPPPAPDVVATLAFLRTRWMTQDRALGRQGASPRDAGLQNSVTQLINDTETQLAPICGAPTGDDALLLLLARSQGQPGQPAEQGGPQ